jgi:uncharacterized protein
MSAIQLIRKHSLLVYFALAFAISWGGIILVVGPGGIPGTPEQFDTLFPPVYLAMLVGPSVAGLLMTGLVGGRAGLREFLSRLRTWRVGARWYLMALLTAPLLVTLTIAVLSLISPRFLPGILTSSTKTSMLLFGVGVGLGAGFLEELGWTGFAVPRMNIRDAFVRSGLVLGVLWGAWHFLAVYWGIASSIGSVSATVFLSVALFSFLPPFRILMVWVYSRTGSLLVAMLMHASLTSSMLIFGPLALTGWSLVIYDLSFAAALWLAVAAVVAYDRDHCRRHEPLTHAA